MRHFSTALACTVCAAIRSRLRCGTGVPVNLVRARLRLRTAASGPPVLPSPCADSKDQGRAAEAGVTREERRTERTAGMDIVFANPPPPATSLRAAIRDSCRADETEAAARILAAGEIPANMRDRIAERARGFVAAVRRQRLGKGGVDAFLHEYALSSPEGVALLCLAEALLRIPDAETVDRLIRDKIGEADWESHLGRSESIFVNASTWALMLTGRLLHAGPAERDLRSALRRLAARSGEPLVRQAVTAAMRILGRQFVIGRTIEEAIERAREAERHGYRHSYDMLGEAARTAADAARYIAAYDRAIAAIGKSVW